MKILPAIFQKLVIKSSPPKYYGKFNIRTAIAILIIHLLAGFAIYYAVLHGGFATTSAIVAGIYFVLAGSGIALGYHRMTTHRSFKAKPWFKNFLLFNACLALQGKAYWWSAVHRAHHAYSDREGDPHSPNNGLLWAHMLWLLFDYRDPKFDSRAEDLLKDPSIIRQGKYFSYIAAMTFIVPAFIGFWAGGLWGALDAFLASSIIGLFAVLHFTWSVNSLTHLYENTPRLKWLERIPLLNLIVGSQPYKKAREGDRSRNNFLLALVTFGKGNHHNHHLQPAAAFQAWRWWEPDLGRWLLLILERFGVVWDLIKPLPPDQLAPSRTKRKSKAGDLFESPAKA